MPLPLLLDEPTEFLLPLTALRDVRRDLFVDHLSDEGRGLKAVQPGRQVDAAHQFGRQADGKVLPRLSTPLVRCRLGNGWRGLLPVGNEAQLDEVPEYMTFVPLAASNEVLDLTIEFGRQQETNFDCFGTGESLATHTSLPFSW